MLKLLFKFKLTIKNLFIFFRIFIEMFLDFYHLFNLFYFLLLFNHSLNYKYNEFLK